MISKINLQGLIQISERKVTMKALKWVDLHLEELCLTVLLLVLTCLVTVNVVLRYILGSGLTWSEAICRYCLVYSTFFTIAHWIRRGSGIAVDFVVQLVPKSVANIFNWIVRIKNKNFWLTVIPALLLLVQVVMNVFGVNLDLGELGNRLLAVVNAAFAFLAALGVVNDPTTKCFGDSQLALTYEKPKED